MNKFAFLVIALMTFVSFVTAQNVGINTTNPLARLHVDLGTSMSNGILFTGGEPAGGTFPSLGAGYRLMYYPARGVFRAGFVEGTQWDNSNVGAFSFGFGYNTTAKGNGSCAIGDAVYAGGTISTAFGNATITKGYSSFVLGMYNDPLIIGADQDFALPNTPLFMLGNGDGNDTRNNAMTIFKNGDLLLKNHTAVTDPEILPPPVVGPGTRMMWLAGKSAFRVGTVDDNSWDADSIGTWSTGIGYNTKAKGQYSLAWGLSTSASGNVSTSMGFLTKATAFGSTAMGINTYAKGVYSTAMGANSRATGKISNSSGEMTVAKGYASTVVGMFNDSILLTDQIVIDSTTPLFIVGNGELNERRNAMVVRKDGHVGIGTSTPNNQLSVVGTVDIAETENFGDTILHSSAQLAVSSTTKGFLPPRMTFGQRYSIVNPEAGLVIYCKDCGVYGQLQVYNGFRWENMMGTSGEVVPYVGAPVPGDGVVFYIFLPGDPGYIAGETHGLYAGLSILDYDWGCMGVEVPGADGTALGTGLQNTIDIKNQCSGPNAAWVCFILDGYLPSKDEMNLLVSSGVVNQFEHCGPPNWHCQWWTSSEIDANSVWVYDYQTNAFVAGQKDNALGNIIPIYSF